jgi:hypothetical protein
MSIRTRDWDPPTDDEVELERLLRLATEQAGYRPAFYRELMNGFVLVPVPPGPAIENAAGKKVLRFVQWRREDGAQVIPFFSSLARLRDSPPSKEPLIRLPARQLFELTRGALLHLNPHSEFGRSFSPDQVESILAFGAPGTAAEKVDVKEGSLGIRPTSEKPEELIDALIVYFSQQQEIQRAYYAELVDLDTGSPTSWLIGIELQGNEDRALAGIASIVQDLHCGGRPVDILKLGDGKYSAASCGLGASDCFYDRSWGASLIDQTSRRPS